MSQDFKVIGIMSGTSLDGLDICCCSFRRNDLGYDYQIIAAESFAYTTAFRNELKAAYELEKIELNSIDLKFGEHIAKLVKHFILKNNLDDEVQLIGSHGQTIFHEPEKGITVQIGNGQTIANLTKIRTITNFRIKDVELGGQGAPLVPIGDQLLFAEAEACLNLGGIANISFDQNGDRIAFDICPANLPLNKLVEEKFGIPFDKNGEISQSGTCIPGLLRELDELPYYTQSHPKSLSQEGLDSFFYPIIDQYIDRPIAHILNTIVAHETNQIATIVNQNNLNSVMVTGGGALNTFFISQLKQKVKGQIILPDIQLIEFKEALIFAFLALLNVNNQVNTLSSVTGASRDSIGGMSWIPES